MENGNAAMRVQQEDTPVVFGETMSLDQLVLAPSQRTDTYRREITEEERNSYNQEIADLSVLIDDKEDEKKATVKMLGDEIKMSKASRKVAITAVKSGGIEVVDSIFSFADYKENKVHEYNSKGERILTRRMKPNERQTPVGHE